MRPALALLAAAAWMLAAAAALLLLAADVRRWEARLVQGDLVFQRDTGRPGLWEPRELVPGSPARPLLRVDDDLAFREALRLFRLGRPRRVADDEPALLALRGEAQAELAALGRSDSEPARRSRATNLVGVLSLVAASGEDAATRATFLESAIASFQTAVKLDGGNEDAKVNLELALRTVQADAPSLASASAPRDNPSGVALRRSGSGY